MADDMAQQIQAFCQAHRVRRLEAEEIAELLVDGEDPDWIAGQAAADRPEVAAALTELLARLAPEPPAPEAGDERVIFEGDATDVDVAAAADATLAPEAAAAERTDPDELQAQLVAALGDQLPPGVDAGQLQQFMASPRGQILADFSAFCHEQDYDGDDEEAMRAAHDEWLQTPRDSLDGKRPAEVLEGGGLLPGKVETYRREVPKVGRNDPCPCGSGKKFKKCHGR